jgi:hypothetical protein
MHFVFCRGGVVHFVRKVLDVSQAELVRIPIDEIIPDIIQPRQTYDTTALNRLAYSLRNFGLLNPLWIERKDKADALSYIERWDNSRIKEFYTQKVRDSFSSQIMLLLVGHRRWLAGLRAAIILMTALFTRVNRC